MKRALFWFRRDLRVSDQHALAEATAWADEVLPVFIIDETITRPLPKNDKRITFIQGCLDELSAEFGQFGSMLLVLAGDPAQLIPTLVQEHQINAVFCNRDYEPAAKLRDEKIALRLQTLGIEFRRFKDQVLVESREVLNLSGEPYRVFTPYSKAWIKQVEAKKLHQATFEPKLKKLMPMLKIKSGLKQESTSFWKQGFLQQDLAASEAKGVTIEPGEKAAKRALKRFQLGISQYQLQRDFPAVLGTSILSPHFRFGTLSIREAVRFCYANFSAGAKVWLTELIWREFYQMILDQFPHVVGHSFKLQYDELKWSGSEEHFTAWCKGETGYPLVDAAMRQLNETGWMHNRLRMITAMFLTKDLLVDWRKGEAYFALKLLDFDLASNNGGWQWSASTGCDAQPYFRIMNPVSQSEKFDPSGDFIQQWVPELKKVPASKVHWPHEEGLFSINLQGYPDPIVDHKTQRQKALQLFKSEKS